MCGEQSPHPRRCHRDLGSPPRVRGTGLCVQIHLAQKGITPACAGNSRLLLTGTPVGKDHPRVCGEQEQRLLDRAVREGSPPRVRGTERIVTVARSIGGITPACAGNSRCSCQDHGGAGDHPRVCGEQVMVRKIAGVVGGSPPRVRGTGLLRICTRNPHRITPACAGNSPLVEAGWTEDKDHPRVCGEQLIFNIYYSIGPGSPPRVRGTVHM